MADVKDKQDKDAGKDQAAEKPPEYQRFEDVLNKVIKAPPMKKNMSK